MVCHNPYIKQHKGEILTLQCGKCPKCKIRRVNQWIFRIMQEQKNSTSAYFVTLTYKNKFLPRTQRKLGTLKKSDLQNFIKRLREYEKEDGNPSIIKYFAAGEYGTETKRPHYHAILLNVNNKENIGKSWTKKKQQIGNIDIGTVTQSSIAYTIKYIDKECKIGYARNDQREKTFQLMSKGLGEKYLTEQQIEYHRNNPKKNYVQDHLGNIVGMPRYYAKKIWNTDELAEQRRKIIVPHLEELYEIRKLKFENRYKFSYEEHLNLQKSAEKTKFVKNINEYKRDQI